ncbi:unnamed protein product [Trichobilharzia regenti]|nr:unnamed protein product [Trichobilharzia regenti]
MMMIMLVTKILYLMLMVMVIVTVMKKWMLTALILIFPGIIILNVDL